MNEIKYEAVFGDQSLFDEAIFGAIAAISNGFVKIYFNDYDKFLIEVMKCNDLPLSDVPEFAIRRIIPEPKRWTQADKDAGRLPDVGVVVFFNKDESLDYFYPINEWLDGDELNVLAHVKAENGIDCVAVYNARYKCTTQLVIKSIKHIESPEEKALRLENEWVDKAFDETAVFSGVTDGESGRLKTHLRRIYKAQLSGELKAPGVE